MPLRPSNIFVELAHATRWGVQNICQFCAWDECDFGAIEIAPGEGAETRNLHCFILLINHVTAILGEGTPELVNGDEAILLAGHHMALVLPFGLLPLLVEVAANLPNEVAQLNCVVVPKVAEVGQRSIFVEGLLDEQLLQLDLVHVSNSLQYEKSDYFNIFRQ